METEILAQLVLITSLLKSLILFSMASLCLLSAIATVSIATFLGLKY